MRIKHLAVILLLAAVIAICIRIFLFETIRVTSQAMSENQTVGNRLIVSKWELGARLPLSVGIPYVPDSLFGFQTYFNLFQHPIRLPGFGKINRNDLLVFNYPDKSERPIDMRPILLSRCVGLPGEFIRLKGTRLFINDVEIKRHTDASFCYSYPIRLQKELNYKLIKEKIDRETYHENDSGFIYLTKYQYYALNKENDNVIKFKSCISTFDKRNDVIPYEGFRITLNDLTYRTWGDLINRYEGVRLKISDNGYFKENGKIIEEYIFKQNYYWVLNDHQGYLNDSRSFGLVPESYVIGKASFILFSPNNGRFLQKI
jgi:signal peptidase I